jgi:DNA-directed RNA polymerase specialized sigma24 family protein
VLLSKKFRRRQYNRAAFPSKSVLVLRYETIVTPAQAEAIRLVKLEGYSIAEAAQRTGRSRQLVKVNIHRGMGKMQRTASVIDEMAAHAAVLL